MGSPAGHGGLTGSRQSASVFCRRLLLTWACAHPLVEGLLTNSSHRRYRHERINDYVNRLREYSFGDFVRQFGRTYEQGTEEWDLREKIFNTRVQEVIDFHSGPPQSWSMGITKFMDFTDPEFNALLGYKGRRNTSPSSKSSLLAIDRRAEKVDPPKSVNTLTSNSKLALVIRDQGGCGSCWAQAAVSVLEARIEDDKTLMGNLKAKAKQLKKKVTVPTLSTQTVVSCAPNPRHCGGTGGCGGATSELAFKMIKENGLPLAMSWAYKSWDGNSPVCQPGIFDKAVVGIDGWTVLPANKLNPLKQSLYDSHGPIVITVAASGWAHYERGIYSDGPAGDFEVNHAVVLVGYRDPVPEKKQMGYWIIKNSWGDSWGENGYIRVEMKANEEEHCGWDFHPQEGTACDGDPEQTWVCGTCGILYDSCYPTGIHVKE